MMKAMKRLASALCAFVLLSACGGGSDHAAVECHKEYWDGTIGLCLPKGWSVINRETLRSRGAPDDTIAAFQSDAAVTGQFPTVTVTVEPLVQEITAEQYSEASIRSVSVLPGYTLLDNTSVNIDEKSVGLHIFTAQPIADEPVRKFYQVSSAVGNNGYTVTGAVPVSTEDHLEEEILLILQSTTFVEKSEE